MTLRYLVGLILAIGLAGCGSDGSASLSNTDRSPGIEAPATSDQLSFGLSSTDDGYRLDVRELLDRGGQAIAVDVSSDGAAISEFDDDSVHVFEFGRDLSHFSHRRAADLNHWMNVDDTGPLRVVVAFTDQGREVLLGADVTVSEQSDFQGGIPNATQSELVHGSGVMVERDGWNFDVTGTWPAEPLYGTGAWLTLIRVQDLALSFDHVPQVGDGIYSFDPEVIGAGEHLAVLEVAGAPSFSFLLAIDDDGSIGEPIDSDLLDEVEAFVQAVDDGNTEAILAVSSSRCRERLSELSPVDLMPDIDPEQHYWTTSIVADTSGIPAAVTYETIEGEYTVGQTPFWRERTEDWIFEDSEWRRDTCGHSGIDW